MQAPNSLLRPRPACFANRPPVRTAFGVNLAWIEGRLKALFPSGPETMSSLTRPFPTRPLLPETIFCRRVVEGRVRSLLVAATAMLALWGCLGTIWASRAHGSYIVQLRSQASIKGSMPVLGDIADLRGDDETLLAQLARTPLGTITDARLLSRAEIVSLIRNVAANPGDVIVTGAEFTKVFAETRAPEAAEIAAVVKSYLASVTRWREEEIEVKSIDNLKAILLPEGELQLRVISRGVPASFRSTVFSVEAIQDGKPPHVFWVKADVHVRAQVVQVARPVAFRSVLKADDLREQTCEIDDPRAAYFRTAAEAVGKIAKRALGKGELLSQSSLEQPGLVRSGETVRLVLESGGLHMTVLARALQNGKLGDPIKVRNIDSDRVITAVITGRGEVRVAN
jgi:flagellar basal body P-ring formation protein FlgA